jgi:hypothetical protein
MSWTPQPTRQLCRWSSTRRSVARGKWLNEGTAHEPVAVLGSAAAEQLGIDRVYPDQRIWLGDQWFNDVEIVETHRVHEHASSAIVRAHKP